MAFSNAIKAVKFVRPAEDTSSAAPAPSATPTATLPANTANAPLAPIPYSVIPQLIEIGQTRYRALPANMLSRLSLASLKDIMNAYDEEGENVPKMAMGGMVQPMQPPMQPMVTQEDILAFLRNQRMV